VLRSCQHTIQRPANLLLRTRQRRAVTFKRLLRALAASAASRGDAQLILQLVERDTAIAGSAGDVSVGHTVANANNHGRMVMRTIRIRNTLDQAGVSICDCK
jgi:hypothetical protein